MKVTETTPKVERTFTIELTEIELRTLVTAYGLTCDSERSANAKGMIITGVAANGLYCELLRALESGE